MCCSATRCCFGQSDGCCTNLTCNDDGMLLSTLSACVPLETDTAHEGSDQRIPLSDDFLPDEC